MHVANTKELHLFVSTEKNEYRFIFVRQPRDRTTLLKCLYSSSSYSVEKGRCFMVALASHTYRAGAMSIFLCRFHAAKYTAIALESEQNLEKFATFKSSRF